MTVLDHLNSKYGSIFDHFDGDNDGVITPDDFERVAKTAVAVFGYGDESAPKIRLLADHYGRLWHHLHGSLEASGDNQLTRDEFANALLNMSVEDEFLADCRTSLLIEFVIADTDDNGTITKDEYAKVLKAFRPDAVDAGAAFDHLDKDGDGQLTLDEYTGSWVDVITTVDPRSPGNVAIARQLVK